MALFNKTFSAILPFVPRTLAKPFASRYVAGETVNEALEIIRKLNDKGFATTLDILGEHTTSTEKIESVTQAYKELYDRISEAKLDCNISLKLTHLGMGFDNKIVEENLTQVLNKARQHDNFLRIDMENSPYTDLTLKLYGGCLEQYNKVGFVLQSYLFRSTNDLENHLGKKLNVRICKGIYQEPPEIAFHDREDIRENFISLVKVILRNEGYGAIATHDLYLIDTLETWIRNRKIPRERYEFQVLFGVPMKGRLEQLRDAGHKVRVYVPFGEEWYAYAVRRLKENPNLAGYIIKNLFTKRTA
ncbi:MAG: proline dehydrogenase family protein [Candidatus Marinimicrobia bacterium]|jgi:proline dehydrogenase|nr:proline dehydrogenase family protein [Candidatus Neomarinimicrobiota bacterium]